jgi:UDP-N-acetylglucosamine acyltransferase
LIEYMQHGTDISIHPTAIVSPESRIAERVSIGPFTLIGPEAEIGPDTEIGPHVVIEGKTRLGPRVKVFQFASIGAPPQDLKYAGEPTTVDIGEGSVIREFVTVHRGTERGGGATRVGCGNLLMAYCHIAHDCQVGDHVIMANGVTLGGHVVIGDHVIIGGLSAIHQFCHIGAYAFLGGMSGVNKDIPPYVRYWGARGRLYGLNLVGLRRHGLSRESLDALRDAYRMIFQGHESVTQSLQTVESRLASVPEVRTLVQFIRNSKRGVPTIANGDEEL